MHFYFHFSAQFWHFQNGKLLNKKVAWKYQDKDWRIPTLNEKGSIKYKKYVLAVLGIGNEGCEVRLQAPKGPTTESQVWEPVDTEQDGYFKIFHDSSRLCLTAKSNDILTIEGNVSVD